MAPKTWTLLRWMGFAALLASLAAGFALHAQLGIEWSLESVRSVVEDFGIWAPLGFVAIVAARSILLLPSQLVLTGGGLAFGAAGGTIWGGLGLLLNATAIFGVVRWLGLEAVASRVPRRLHQGLDAAGSAGGAAALALATAYPVGPIALYQAAAGLTRMSIALNLGAAATGCLARAGLYASFGSSLVEGRRLQAALALGVILLSLLPLLHPRMRERLGILRGEVPAGETHHPIATEDPRDE